MSVLLSDADTLVLDSILHIGSSTFSATKRRNAIKAACNRFLREVPSSWTTVPVELNAGQSTVDLTAGITGFNEDRWVRASIGFSDVSVVPYITVQRRHDGASPSGKPKWIGFRSPREALFDKTCDTAYTMQATVWNPLVDFDSAVTITSGDPSTDIELNLPAGWEHDILWWGARAYLIYGAPGHPDAAPAMERFEAVIASAGGRFPSIQKGVNDSTTVRSETVMDSRSTPRRSANQQ